MPKIVVVSVVAAEIDHRTHNVIDAGSRHLKLLGKAVDRQSHWLHKPLLQENLAWVNNKYLIRNFIYFEHQQN